MHGPFMHAIYDGLLNRLLLLMSARYVKKGDHLSHVYAVAKQGRRIIIFS